MFDTLLDIASAWRTIAHISEWSGVSVGMLLAGAGLVYLRPALLKPVICGGVAVVLVWFGLIHGDRTGRADVETQWADARKAAIAADAERDVMTEQKLEATYQPKLAALQKLAEQRKQEAQANERKINSSKTPARAVCELGAAADRVPAGLPVGVIPARRRTGADAGQPADRLRSLLRAAAGHEGDPKK